MNATDAQRFAEECKPAVAVPYHYGMLDDITAESFDFKNKIVFNIYEERDI
jgi:L-ascorbate metabolism protein UlaG (beta-lactamase superfamily)